MMKNASGGKNRTAVRPDITMCEALWPHNRTDQIILLLIFNTCLDNE